MRRRQNSASSIFLASLLVFGRLISITASSSDSSNLRGRQAQTTTCYSINPAAPDDWCVTNKCPADSCSPGSAPAPITDCASTGGWSSSWCQTHGCPSAYCKRTTSGTTPTTTVGGTKAPTKRPTKRPTKSPSTPTTSTPKPTKRPTRKPTTTTPAVPTTSGAWEAWATTTVFGDGEKEWPAGVKNAEDLTKINNPKSVPYATMGGAIPWRFYCKEYGGRQKLLDAIYAAWTEGTSSAKVCFEVQPITVLPSQLAQGSYDLPSLKQAGKTVYDINDNAIAAVDANGNPYPIYQIVPYEGCGGNCQGNVPDCTNTCYADPVKPGENVNAGIHAVLDCNYGQTTSTACTAMRSLWDAAAWANSPVRWNDFLQYSCAFSIDYTTGSWQRDFSPCGLLNWCSGFNMHFDVALEHPYWYDIKPQAGKEPASQSVGDYNNVMVRYRRTRCKPWK